MNRRDSVAAKFGESEAGPGEASSIRQPDSPIQPSAATGSREWAQIRNALDYYADQWNWGEDDWGIKAVLTGRGGYGNPTEKAKRARDAMRRLETKLNAD